MTARGIGVVSALLAASLLAWIAVAADTRGMRGPATDLGGDGSYAGLWLTMTAAMMLPSATPAILLVDRLAPRATPLFVGGYLVVWTAFGLGAYALVRIALAAGLGGWRAAGPLAAEKLVPRGAQLATPLAFALVGAGAWTTVV